MARPASAGATDRPLLRNTVATPVRLSLSRASETAQQSSRAKRWVNGSVRSRGLPPWCVAVPAEFPAGAGQACRARQIANVAVCPANEAAGTPGQTESVGKAIRLLTLFRGAQTPLRIADASAATGLARSTTHRLLATLQAQDFVRQDRATRAYYPGPALLELARSLSRDIELREIAQATR